MPEIIIIGGGLTGLSTAYHLKKPCLVLEKNNTPGGICGSVRAGGYTFDYSGHFLHTHKSLTKKLLDSIMPGKLQKIDRNASVYTENRFIPYPFQANLYHLPERTREECLRGFLKRRSAVFSAGMDFLSWSESVFGKGITRHFMKPYNEKLWTVSGRRLTADWVAPFVPMPDAREIIGGASSVQKKDFGYNVSFYYPRRGGCGSIADAFYNKLSNVSLGVKAERIDLRKKIIHSTAGRFEFDHLVSTQPLPELLATIEDLPSAVKRAGESLSWNSVECVNLAFESVSAGERPAGGRHWIYFPENKFVFYRAGIYTNINPSMAPKGHFSMYVEISRNPRLSFNKKQTLKRTIEGLSSAGIIDKHRVPELNNVLSLPYAYVIYDKKRTSALKIINEFLRLKGVYSIGRYGAWEYSFMESSILDGRRTAEALNAK